MLETKSHTTLVLGNFELITLL